MRAYHLPGVCVVCREPVFWNGKRWMATRWRKHECPVDRPVCGVLMAHAHERCARAPGHASDAPGRGPGHRTAYAMENARQAKRMGRAA
jgi:hypothetical protein